MTRRTGGLALLVAVLVPIAGCSSPDPGADGTEAAADRPVAATDPPEVVDPAATDAPRPTGTDVVLSTASWVEADGVVVAGGYVSPVVEEGGTCTLRLEKDGEVRTVTAAALPDATTTVCGGLRTAPGDLTAGRWTAVLEYSSASIRAGAASAPLVVEVPR